MAALTLSELTASSTAAEGFEVVPPSGLKVGGVDPLGLRQINFDLMDKVFPGLNNVARHIRPFVVVAWAWRRAHYLAAMRERAVDPSLLVDFVDRIEVVYAWSQFLMDTNADLPGRQALDAVVRSDRYAFNGVEWDNRKKERRYSTAFTAAVNYGPGLKSLGWVGQHHIHSDLLVSLPATIRALNAFQALIADRLDHPVFSELGAASVTGEEVERWGEAWSLETVTEAEKETMAEMLFGTIAPATRKEGGGLMVEAVRHLGAEDVSAVRKAMAGEPTDFMASSGLGKAFSAWRGVQIRQLFRLAVEACFSWVLRSLDGGPMTSPAMAKAFLAQAGIESGAKTADAWLGANHLGEVGPTDLIDRISAAIAEPAKSGLPRAIVDAVAFCMAQASGEGETMERPDRLPLSKAKREADARKDTTAVEFARHVLESWVFAQHAYWSVGRGLADARSRERFILRLKVVMDEGGWTLAPGVSSAYFPRPTADRLQTALSLADECGLF